MAILIEKQFTIEASPDSVWAFLTDPARVAGCLPGASITEQIDDHTYAGSMKMKVGPVSTSYKGKVTFESLDKASLTAKLRATGLDVQGRGGADMTMTSQLTPQDGGTAVVVTSEVNVTGILAQFGRGMIQDVSDQMFQTFTTNMRAQLAGPAEGDGGGEAPPAPSSAPASGGAAPGPGGAPSAPSAAPARGGTAAGPPRTATAAPVAQEEALDVGALGFRIFGRMAIRTLRRPVFWVGVVVVLALIYWLLIR